MSWWWAASVLSPRAPATTTCWYDDPWAALLAGGRCTPTLRSRIFAVPCIDRRNVWRHETLREARSWLIDADCCTSMLVGQLLPTSTSLEYCCTAQTSTVQSPSLSLFRMWNMIRFFLDFLRCLLPFFCGRLLLFCRNFAYIFVFNLIFSCPSPCSLGCRATCWWSLRVPLTLFC